MNLHLRVWMLSLTALGFAAPSAVAPGALRDAVPPAVELTFLAPGQRPHAASAEPGRSDEALPADGRYRVFEGHSDELERRLFQDAEDGCWDVHSLLSASLVASGVTEADAVRRYEARFAHAVAELQAIVGHSSDPRQRAQAVFEYMHRRLLRTYQLDGTDLGLALGEGKYNCVSATVLFNCLAGALGLSVRGVEVPGHALSRLELPGGAIEVETTCPTWFQVLGDPEKLARLRAQRPGRDLGHGGAVAARSNDSAAGRTVSDVQLAAAIYYNRGVDLLGQRRFEQAIACNAKAMRLDPHSHTARGNLLATLNNWAIGLAAEGHFPEAVGLLRRGLAVEPGYTTFLSNYHHVHRQWSERLCREGRYEAALEALARGVPSPGAPHDDRPWAAALPLQSLRVEVYRRWIAASVDRGQREETGRLLARARAELASAGAWEDLSAAVDLPLAGPPQ